MSTQDTKPKKKKICPICKKEFTGKGYSTYPLEDNPIKKCCRTCHTKVIVPLLENLVVTLGKLDDDYN